MELAPIVLEGPNVRLEALEETHAEPLWQASVDTEVWRYMPFRPRTVDELRSLIRAGHALRAAGTGLGFAIVARAAGEPVGATGFWNVDPAHRRLEIGMSWVTRRWQRTAVNTETKLLLLSHAFDTLSCMRVEFKTDARNAPSRAALRRIGATEEGTLRRHMLLPGGDVRDSVYYSVVDLEWPRVKAHLRSLLERGGGANARDESGDPSEVT